EAPVLECANRWPRVEAVPVVCGIDAPLLCSGIKEAHRHPFCGSRRAFHCELLDMAQSSQDLVGNRRASKLFPGRRPLQPLWQVPHPDLPGANEEIKIRPTILCLLLDVRLAHDLFSSRRCSIGRSDELATADYALPCPSPDYRQMRPKSALIDARYDTTSL